MSEEWCTIESDPGVFTELLEDLGCPGVELQELWSLDDEALSQLSGGTGTDTIYGLIFLFQWVGETQKEHAQTQQPLEEDAIPPNLFFAHQTTTNACATQAILSVLLNADALDGGDGDDSPLGPVLANFKGFTAEFPPNLKGLAIAGSEEIRKAHNRFGRTDAFLQDGRKHIPTGDEEAFHFVAYVPKNGEVYELDGLQKGPILVKNTGEEDDASNGNWLAVARQAIQERMTKAQQGSIKFNLMAVTQDKRAGLRKQLEEGGDVETIQLLLAQEEEKRAQWKKENERRRHNYVPFCVQVLKELAAMGKLPELVQGAKDKQAEKRRKLMAKS